MNCPKCNAIIKDGASFCPQCGTKAELQAAAPLTAPTPIPTPAPAPAPMAASGSSSGKNFDFSGGGAVASQSSRKTYQYKVLSQKDKWFSGKFDPALLEQAINAYAQQGWRVVGCATADIPGFGNARQEFITLLEREV